MEDAGWWGWVEGERMEVVVEERIGAGAEVGVLAAAWLGRAERVMAV